MRRADHGPLEPEVGHALAVIDATLAGDPVEPQDADLAELTLILAGQRPVASRQFSDSLDARVAARFSEPARPQRASGSAPSSSRTRRRWLWAPGALAGVAAAVAVAVVIPSLGGSGSSNGSGGAAGSGQLRQESLAARPRLLNGQATVAGTSSSAAASSVVRTPSPSAGTEHRPEAPPAFGSPAAAAGSLTPDAAPLSGNRQVIQSAQLSLSTGPDQVDAVAQQVFDVVAAQKGYVQRSTVTATGSAAGYAQFQLSVPSTNLQVTMTELSRLHGAAVVSRTDTSQDVTADLGGAGRRLADARALRTSLLRRLAAATTSTAIASLEAQLRDAEASIAGNLATLHTLHHSVENTEIAVTLNASLLPGHHRPPATGFTLHTAAHDAGRVLVIAAGVALIALAVLVPLTLLAGIGLWMGFSLRRRRREQALDLV